MGEQIAMLLGLKTDRESAEEELANIKRKGVDRERAMPDTSEDTLVPRVTRTAEATPVEDRMTPGYWSKRMRAAGAS